MTKNKNIYKLILFATLVFLPTMVASAYTLEMALPGTGSTVSGADAGAFLANYLTALFKFGFYLLAFLAVAMIVYGGIMYMVPGKTGEAKEKIWGAVIGVFFLMCSYLILQTIDPELLSLNPKVLTKLKALKPGATTQIKLDQTQNFAYWFCSETDNSTYLTGSNKYTSEESCKKSCASPNVCHQLSAENQKIENYGAF